MKIGILQTGNAPEALLGKHGDFTDMFEALFKNQGLKNQGFEFVNFDVAKQQFPKSITQAQGWLITGSKCGAYEDHPWIKPLENLLREIYESKAPVVGICFGHQIFAQALGGKVEKFQGGWSIGMQKYNLKEINKNDGSPNDSPNTCLPAWHQDQITQKPESATVIGVAETCKFAALKYGKQALTMQPHPEFKINFLKDLLELRKKNLPLDVTEKAIETLSRNNDAVKVAKYIADFYRQAL